MLLPIRSKTTRWRISLVARLGRSHLTANKEKRGAWNVKATEKRKELEERAKKAEEEAKKAREEFEKAKVEAKQANEKSDKVIGENEELNKCVAALEVLMHNFVNSQTSSQVGDSRPLCFFFLVAFGLEV